MLFSLIVSIFILQVYANEDLPWWSPEKCIYKLPKDLECKRAGGCCANTTDTNTPCPQNMFWDPIWICDGEDSRKCCRPSECSKCEPPSNIFVCSYPHSILKLGGICSTSCKQVYFLFFWFAIGVVCTLHNFTMIFISIVNTFRQQRILQIFISLVNTFRQQRVLHREQPSPLQEQNENNLFD